MDAERPTERTAAFPLAEHLGLTIETTGSGTARASVVVDERHHNPNAVAHGAVVYTMADTSMGAATMSIVPPGHYCSTIEIQVRYLRPFVSGALTVETQVLKPGRRVVHLESRAVDADGRLIAVATGSFAVLPLPER